MSIQSRLSQEGRRLWSEYRNSDTDLSFAEYEAAGLLEFIKRTIREEASVVWDVRGKGFGETFTTREDARAYRQKWGGRIIRRIAFDRSGFISLIKEYVGWFEPFTFLGVNYAWYWCQPYWDAPAEPLHPCTKQEYEEFKPGPHKFDTRPQIAWMQGNEWKAL